MCLFKAVEAGEAVDVDVSVERLKAKEAQCMEAQRRSRLYLSLESKHLTYLYSSGLPEENRSLKLCSPKQGPGGAILSSTEFRRRYYILYIISPEARDARTKAV
jgi:hypothetical protein